MLIASSWTITFASKIMYIMWSTFKWLIFQLSFPVFFMSVCSRPEIAFNSIPYMPLFFVNFDLVVWRAVTWNIHWPKSNSASKPGTYGHFCGAYPDSPAVLLSTVPDLHLLEHLLYSIPQWTLWLFILAHNSANSLEVGTFFYLSLWPLLYIGHFA